jgi:hypothetical protein
VPSFDSVGCFIIAWAGGHPVEAPAVDHFLLQWQQMYFSDGCLQLLVMYIVLFFVTRRPQCARAFYKFWLANPGWCAGRLE